MARRALFFFALLAPFALTVAPAGCDRVLGFPDWQYDESLLCDGGQCACKPGRADCNGTFNDGCETDTDHDPYSCGACFRSCLGGACMDGVCSPVRIATLDREDIFSSGVDSLSAGGGHLYVSYFSSVLSGPRFVRLPTTGAPAPWAREELFTLADASGGFLLDRRKMAAPAGLFLPTDDAAVLHVGIGASAGVRAVATAAGSIEAMGLADGCLYLGIETGSDPLGYHIELSRVDLAAAMSPVAASPVAGLPTWGSIPILAGDGEVFFFATEPGSKGEPAMIQRSRPTCGEVEPLLTLEDARPVSAMAIDPSDGTLYFAVGDHDSEIRARLPDGRVEALGTTPRVDTLIADGGEAYWLSLDAGSIGRARWTGKEAVSDVVLRARNLDREALAVDHDRLYWSEGLSLYTVARPPAQKE